MQCFRTRFPQNIVRDSVRNRRINKLKYPNTVENLKYPSKYCWNFCPAIGNARQSPCADNCLPRDMTNYFTDSSMKKKIGITDLEWKTRLSFRGLSIGRYENNIRKKIWVLEQFIQEKPNDAIIKWLIRSTAKPWFNKHRVVFHKTLPTTTFSPQCKWHHSLLLCHKLSTS